jgi:hypothetical protein
MGVDKGDEKSQTHAPSIFTNYVTHVFASLVLFFDPIKLLAYREVNGALVIAYARAPLHY